MSKRFTKKKTFATAGLDPAALATLKKEERDRHRARRRLLKRRRAKSHQ